MRAATLASLLVTSAAAGAAAAGGPFFFAQTTPYSVVTPLTVPSQNSPFDQALDNSVTVTVPVDFVLTDLLLNQFDLVGVEVNGVMKMEAVLGLENPWSASDGAGVPIPAGSSVRLWSSNPGLRITMVGYHY